MKRLAKLSVTAAVAVVMTVGVALNGYAATEQSSGAVKISPAEDQAAQAQESSSINTQTDVQSVLQKGSTAGPGAGLTTKTDTKGSSYGPGGSGSAKSGNVGKTVLKTDWTKVSSVRKAVVAEAKKLVGGTYVYGGTDPKSGLDCSGLTQYVMKQAAHISLKRSSSEQATEGREIKSTELLPGDLICYDGDSSDPGVNHIAVYVGDGKIVHAVGTGKGIQESAWDYEAPMYIRNVIGS